MNRLPVGATFAFSLAAWARQPDRRRNLDVEEGVKQMASLARAHEVPSSNLGHST